MATPRTSYPGRGEMFYNSATLGAIFNYGPIAAGRALSRGSASTDRSQRVNHLDNQILTNSSKTHSRRRSATAGHSWPHSAIVGQCGPQLATDSHSHPRSAKSVSVTWTIRPLVTVAKHKVGHNRPQSATVGHSCPRPSTVAHSRPRSPTVGQNMSATWTMTSSQTAAN